MQRTVRLFSLVQLLWQREHVSLDFLTERCGGSKATIEQDIRALQASGFPIQGGTVSGYSLMDHHDFPPVMLTEQESGALLIYLRGMVKANMGYGPEVLADIADKLAAALGEPKVDRDTPLPADNPVID